MADGKITFDTAVDNSGLQSGLSQSKSIASGFKGTIGKLGKAAIAAVSISAIVNFGKQAIELGSNVAEVQNVVDTAFGDMSYKIEEFAGSAVQNFGMSQLSAKKTASTYMAMAKSMGLEESAASDMAISLTGLTGDVASFYNISQELADTKLKSVFTGETETLKELGVVMTQTNLNAFAMANGYGKTIDKMTQAEAVQLRYAYVTNQLRLASGDFIKTQDSWANQTRILSEQWKELMSVLGQCLIQVLTPMVKVLNQVVGYLINVANAASAAMSALFGTNQKNYQQTSSAAAAVAGDIASATENQEALTDATNETAKAAKNAALGFDELNIISQDGGDSGSGSGGNSSAITEPVNGSIVSEVEKEEQGVESIFEKVRTKFAEFSMLFTTMFAPSIEAWGTAFGKLKAPADSAMKNMKSGLTTLWTGTLKPVGTYIVQEFVPDITNSVSENLAPVWSDVMSVAIEEAGSDFQWFADTCSKITNDQILPTMELAKTVTTDSLDTVGKTWGEYGTSLTENFTQAKENVRTIMDDLYDKHIKPVTDNLIKNAKELWEEHLKPLWDNVCGFLASAGEAIMTVWNNFLAPLIRWIITVVGPVVTDVINTISTVVSTVFGIITDVLSGIFKSLKGLMNFITGVFSGDWEKAWTGIKDFVGGIWDTIWAGIKGTINLIVDGLNSLWSGIYSFFKGIVDGIGDAVGWVGSFFGKDWHFSMPESPPLIPHLAQGAVIPPNREFLAVLGDQKSGTNIETPLDTMIQAFKTALADGGYAGGDTVVNLTATLDGDVIYRNQERIRQQRGTKTILTGTFAR